MLPNRGEAFACGHCLISTDAMDSFCSTFLCLAEGGWLPLNVSKDLRACVCGSDMRCKVVDKYWPKDVECGT